MTLVQPLVYIFIFYSIVVGLWACTSRVDFEVVQHLDGLRYIFTKRIKFDLKSKSMYYVHLEV